MNLRPALVVSALAMLAVACGDDSAAPPPAPSSSTTTSTLAATVTDAADAAACAAAPTEMRTLVDERRSTPATAQTDELASRTLDVWIDRPAEALATGLVIFAHGLTGHPRTHELHRRALAEDCFVVVAPAFPLTNADVPDGFLNAGDISGQVGDVTFLIDTFLEDPELGSTFDRSRIGIIGHSLGGLTAAGAALSPDGDPRISAAVVMSAGFGEARDDVAVMVVHGDADPVVPFAGGEVAYDLLTGRRIFVTLLGGDHLAGILDDDRELGVVVREITGLFFAHELGAASSADERLDGLPLDLVSIEAATADGPLDDWRDYFSS